MDQYTVNQLDLSSVFYINALINDSLSTYLYIVRWSQLHHCLTLMESVYQWGNGISLFGYLVHVELLYALDINSWVLKQNLSHVQGICYMQIKKIVWYQKTI